MTLQYIYPERFQVRVSSIAGMPKPNLGLFFNGMCAANKILTGYGGQVFSHTQLKEEKKRTHSVYRAQCGSSGFIIDAKNLATEQPEP